MDQKKALAEALTDYIRERKSQEECTGFSDGFRKAWEVLEGLQQKVLDKERPNGYITIAVVPYGYQIDILDTKAYMRGKLSILASECRDWGKDLDADKFEEELITMIRNGKDKQS